MATKTVPPPLPYPKSNRITVYRDDEKWGMQAFLRSDEDLRKLFVCRYELAVDEYDDVAMTGREWAAFAEQLLADHPGCCFFYIS
jgi:hypothetical protein